MIYKIKIDIKEFKNLNPEVFSEEIEKSIEKGLIKVSNKILRRVKLLTPVGIYEPVIVGNKVYNRGKVGGELRRNWNAKLKKYDGKFIATVSNPLEYALYVEEGHRQNVGQFVPVLGKRLKQPYVKGQKMLEKSINKNEIVQTIKKELLK